MAIGIGSQSGGLSQSAEQRPHWRLSRKAQKTMAFYIFLSPWLVGLVALTLLPLIGGFGLSLTNFDGLNWVPFGNASQNTVKFLGLSNYTRILGDTNAIYSLKRVFLWMALNTPAWLIISFLLAYVLHQGIRARGFFRTLFYLPSIIPIVAIAVIGTQLFQSRYGLINQTIDLLIPGFSVKWLSEYALISVTSIAVWTGIGSGMIIFLAGLQNIPPELEEAALIDGANQVQRFFNITIPLMTPVIFFQLIVSIVVALQYFSLPLLMAPNATSNSGLLTVAPQRDVFLFMIHAFQQAFAYHRLGYSLALTWTLVAIIALIAVILFRTARFWVYYPND